MGLYEEHSWLTWLKSMMGALSLSFKQATREVAKCEVSEVSAATEALMLLGRQIEVFAWLSKDNFYGE